MMGREAFNIPSGDTRCRVGVMARWSVLGLVVPAFASVDGINKLGPALPGDPKYFVEISDLTVAPGTLVPAFESWINDYSVSITDPHQDVLFVIPELNLSKWDSLNTPRIILDGQNFEYNAIEPINMIVQLNNSIGPVDRTIVLKLKDPSGQALLGGLFPREHDYRIHITKPPVFEKVVCPQNIIVTDLKGNILTPVPLSHHDVCRVLYTFDMPEDAKGARLKVQCSEFATGLQIDGKKADPDVTFLASFEEGMVSESVLVQCMYEDPAWTHSKHLERTVEVTLQRSFNLSEVVVQMLVVGGAGVCENDRTHHFSCPLPADFETANLLVNCDNESVEKYLQSRVSGERYDVSSGIPLEIPAHSTYDLVLEAGDFNYVYAVDVGRASGTTTIGDGALCSTLSCPTGWRMREDAWTRHCSGSMCDSFLDTNECCYWAYPCTTFPCTGDYVLKPDAHVRFCIDGGCDAALDRDNCCELKTNIAQPLESKGPVVNVLAETVPDPSSRQTSRRMTDHDGPWLV
uniref:Uncharacterized protein n=1 Tax=Noctiluca scintillans TaxID=2966 RepID=A0A7S1A328_NOCSC